ncbi:MAG: hypothetical protein ACHP65_10235, partial [Legionellales bacterium]
MKKNLLPRVSIGALTCIMGVATAAENHNPCDYTCTQKLIAQAIASQNSQISNLQTQIQNNLPYLSSTGWNNICSSGTPVQGCYGNVGSTAFQQFNQIAGSWTTYAGINVPTNGVLN